LSHRIQAGKEKKKRQATHHFSNAANKFEKEKGEELSLPLSQRRREGKRKEEILISSLLNARAGMT